MQTHFGLFSISINFSSSTHESEVIPIGNDLGENWGQVAAEEVERKGR